MEKQTRGRIVQLYGVRNCCPTAEFTADEIVLRDDFGGTVKLTSKEWREFIAKAGMSTKVRPHDVGP